MKVLTSALVGEQYFSSEKLKIGNKSLLSSYKYFAFYFVKSFALQQFQAVFSPYTYGTYEPAIKHTY